MSDTSSSPAPADELLTAEELAEKLGSGVKYTSILRWRKEGIIPAEICRGKFIRFSLPAVREALRQDAAKQASS